MGEMKTLGASTEMYWYIPFSDTSHVIKVGTRKCNNILSPIQKFSLHIKWCRADGVNCHSETQERGQNIVNTYNIYPWVD